MWLKYKTYRPLFSNYYKFFELDLFFMHILNRRSLVGFSSKNIFHRQFSVVGILKR